MSEPYREQLLERLEDGEWHTATELGHPHFPAAGLPALVRILRAEGHEIEEEIEGDTARFRLVSRP